MNQILEQIRVMRELENTKKFNSTNNVTQNHNAARQQFELEHTSATHTLSPEQFYNKENIGCYNVQNQSSRRLNYDNIQSNSINTNHCDVGIPNMSMTVTPTSFENSFKELARIAYLMHDSSKEVDFRLLSDWELGAAKCVLELKAMFRSQLMGYCPNNTSMVSMNSRTVSMDKLNNIYRVVFGEQAIPTPLSCPSVNSINTTSMSMQRQQRLQNGSGNNEPVVSSTVVSASDTYSSEDNVIADVQMLNSSVITRSASKAKRLLLEDTTFKKPLPVTNKNTRQRKSPNTNKVSVLAEKQNTNSVKARTNVSKIEHAVKKVNKPMPRTRGRDDQNRSLLESSNLNCSTVVSSRGRVIIPTKHFWEVGSTINETTQEARKPSRILGTSKMPPLNQSYAQKNSSIMETKKNTSKPETTKHVANSNKNNKTTKVTQKKDNTVKSKNEKKVEQKKGKKENKSKNDDSIHTEEINAKNKNRRKRNNCSNVPVADKKRKIEHEHPDDSFSTSTFPHSDSFLLSDGEDDMFGNFSCGEALNSVRRSIASSLSGRETPPLVTLNSFLNLTSKSHASANGTVHEFNADKNYVAERIEKKKGKPVPKPKKRGQPKKITKPSDPNVEKLYSHITQSNGGSLSKEMKKILDPCDESDSDSDADFEDDDYIDLA